MAAAYRDFVTVSPRFSRAVSVERDAHAQAAVDGYIITSTAQSVLQRLSRSLRMPGHHAWTLTGPYGSGKSAFAVYLTSLLGPAKSAAGRTAHAILSACSEPLYRELFDRRKSGALSPNGFCSVVLTAGNEPIVNRLLRACCQDVRKYCSNGRPPAALKDLERLHKRAEVGAQVTAADAVASITRTAESLQRSGRSEGLLLVIDELGKFLEFAARNPEGGDIHVLQLMAEATAAFPKPGLLLFTILHQSFDRYCIGLRPSVRDEWSKVQGRYEDIAYQGAPEEFLLLLASAIQHTRAPLSQELEKRSRTIAESAYELGLQPQRMSRREFVELLQRCAPLHPLAALVLARLCRKFGQNQRSLFAFLVSREPHGFSSFLERPIQRGSLPLYEPEDLYDYSAEALGSALSVGEGASRWAEVQTGLEKCLTSSRDEIRVIKTVGLLAAAGNYGNLKPSPSVIELAFAHDISNASAIAQKLVKRSVLVYRKHSDSFALWEGSDIDIEARLQQARKQVAPLSNLASVLTSLYTPRPLVAKRHSVQTGTLRYFATRFTDLPQFPKAAEPSSDADGIIMYAIPNIPGETEALIEIAEGQVMRDRSDVLIAIPRDIEALKESVRELQLLRWVEENTRELQGDNVARRELRARMLVAEGRLCTELDATFSPMHTSSVRTMWFHRGIPQQIPTSRALSQFLSSICDAVYSSTPRLHNELLNRRSLSSAAAKARRNLIEAMITHSSTPKLGIEGTPPEMSMYASVLMATGIHREEESGLAFGAPKTEANLTEVWAAIERFLSSCELQRRGVLELFHILQRPPFGLKMGVIPVLFCAAALAHDTDVALYEDGTFAPELTIELFERLLSSPEKFELRRYHVAGIRREVFNQFAGLLGSSANAERDTLVAVVRPLFRFLNRLPAYTRQTRSLTKTALAVREALFAAREPDVLLFEGLPRSCGFAPFLVSANNSGDVSEFFQELKKALAELQRAYDDLLSNIQQVLLRVFGITGKNGREIIRYRARAVFDCAVEPRLRAFLLHLSDDELEDVPWIESVATLLAGKPPRTWSDADRARYEVNLSELTRNFRHIEALASELANRARSEQPPGDVIRIGVTDRHSKDLEAVIVVEPHDQDALAEAVSRIEDCLNQLYVGGIPSLALASLAMVSRRFLSEIDSPIKPAVETGDVPHA